MKNRTLKLIIFCLMAVSLFAVGWYGHLWFHNEYQSKPLKIIKKTAYRYTSPLLDYELPEGLAVNRSQIPFKNKIDEYVEQKTDGKQIHLISVYFRDLVDGPWFGVNSEYKFNPVSMLSVPVMVCWLHRAQKHPGILQQKLLYDGKKDLNSNQFFMPAQTLVAGKQYSVADLLRYMLNYSDNNAMALLNDNLNPEELKSVLVGMDVTHDPRDSENYISVLGYSGFFRILYNASFLNREISEEALRLLSLYDFPQGITAGVPKGTVVAAKSGNYIRGEDKQLHDFGIVYHSKGAYILGVMTQGNDFARQAEVIKEISAIVYGEVRAAVNASSH